MKLTVKLLIGILVVVVGVGAVLEFTDVSAIAVTGSLTAALVVVTVYYAWSTDKIAKAMKEQVEVNRKMAEEMEQQRRDMVKPALVLRRSNRAMGEGWVSNDLEFTSVDGSDVTLTGEIVNIGKGPAFNISGRGLQSAPPPLKEGEPYATMTWKAPVSDDKTTLELYYTDVFGNRMVTRQTLERKEAWSNFYIKEVVVEYLKSGVEP